MKLSSLLYKKCSHTIARNGNGIMMTTGILLLIIANAGCRKLVQIPEPINSITTSETFNSIQKATSAVTAIYFEMSYGNPINYASGGTTINAGLSADELSVYGGISLFQNNTLLLSTNDALSQTFWNPAYYHIYMVNAAIEGLTASTTLSSSDKNQLIGECKFLRAFCHFYLTNLFGDIPLVTSSSFHTNSILPRASSKQVYRQIIADLKDAQALLPSDYSVSGGERIRANKWAATALLARAYLYTGYYDSAEIEATSIINQSMLFSLTDLNNTFLKNNTEAILQLQTVTSIIYATQEGYQFIPAYLTRDFDSATVSQYWQYFIPPFYLTTQLINAFEPGDLRMSNWVDSTGALNGTNYYYPFKYKVRTGTSTADITEYYTLLRLAEQYLIRAEARAEQNNISGALSDLNVIRSRAGLGNTSANDKASLLTAILHERQVEFFAELGHRWFDLKRTGQADAVLSPIKGGYWQTTDQLWPIPQAEITNDPNLTQNPGYQ